MCGRREDEDGIESDKGVVVVGEPQIHEQLEKISMLISILQSSIIHLNGNRVRLQPSCGRLMKGVISFFTVTSISRR